MPLKILVCLDGEPHSRHAIQWAIRLAVSLHADLTALHIIDPYLKTFSNELYSQGRREYLEHVDNGLHKVAEQIRLEFSVLCAIEEIGFTFKTREGEPLEEILSELKVAPQDLLVMGGKILTPWGRFRSRNLPARLERNLNIPILIVRNTAV